MARTGSQNKCQWGLGWCALQHLCGSNWQCGVESENMHHNITGNVLVTGRGLTKNRTQKHSHISGLRGIN